MQTKTIVNDTTINYYRELDTLITELELCRNRIHTELNSDKPIYYLIQDMHYQVDILIQQFRENT